jgi:hypothetical protein
VQQVHDEQPEIRRMLGPADYLRASGGVPAPDLQVALAECPYSFVEVLADNPATGSAALELLTQGSS